MAKTLTPADLARKASPEAIAALVSIIRRGDSPPAAVVAAANSLLERGYGKTVQPVVAQIEHKNVKDWSMPELLAYMEREVIEGELTEPARVPRKALASPGVPREQ